MLKENTSKWSCPLRVRSRPLALLDPKVNDQNIVDRCGDDSTFGQSDKVGQFIKVSHQVVLRNNAAYYSGYNVAQNMIIVSFRGTESLKSCLVGTFDFKLNICIDAQFWMTDASPISKSFANGTLVHKGFLSAYLSLRSNCQSAVVGLSRGNPLFKIVFTGHRLVIR